MSAGLSPQVLLRKGRSWACRGTLANAVRPRLGCARPCTALAPRSTASGPLRLAREGSAPGRSRRKTGPTRKVLQPGYGLGEQCPRDHHPLPLFNSPASAAHVALHRVVSHVAVATLYPDRPGVVL